MRTEKLFDEIGKVDDTLIEESRVTKISYRKENKTRRYVRRISYSIGGMAAALLIIMAGSYIMNNLSTGYDTSSSQEESMQDGSESLSGQAKEEEDYSKYFSKDFSQFLCIDYTLEAGGKRYELTGKENMPELPFDTSIYEEFSADIYADADDHPYNVLFSMKNEKEQYFSLVVSRGRDTFAEFGLDGQPYTEQDGVKIYGIDKGEGSLSAYFVNAGIGYSLQAENISYEQMWENVQAVLSDGIDLDGFDMADATASWTEVKTLSLSQADKLSFIKGIVPNKEQYDGYQLSENQYYGFYKDQEIVNEEYDLLYKNDNNEVISLVYQMKYEGEEYSGIKASKLTEESLASGYMDGTYSLCIEFDDTIVEISAQCDKSTLWNLLSDSVLGD